MNLTPRLALLSLVAAALLTAACEGENCILTGACELDPDWASRILPPPTASQQAHFRAMVVSPGQPHYWPLIQRWEGPIAVRIQYGGTAADSTFVLALVDEVRTLTGRAIEFKAESQRQVRIVYSTRDHFQVGYTIGDGGLFAADAFIDPERQGDARDAATLRGLLQALGMVGRENAGVEMSDDDRYVLRALYHDAVRSGMTAQEAESALSW